MRPLAPLFLSLVAHVLARDSWEKDCHGPVWGVAFAEVERAMTE